MTLPIHTLWWGYVMDFASDLNAGKPVFEGIRRPWLGTMLGCRQMPGSNVLRGTGTRRRSVLMSTSAGRKSRSPSRSSVSRVVVNPRCIGGHIVAFRGWGRGQGEGCARALAPVSCVMPGCRAPMRSKSKQCFGAVSYTERSIEMKRAVKESNKTSYDNLLHTPLRSRCARYPNLGVATCQGGRFQ